MRTLSSSTRPLLLVAFGVAGAVVAACAGTPAPTGQPPAGSGGDRASSASGGAAGQDAGPSGTGGGAGGGADGGAGGPGTGGTTAGTGGVTSSGGATGGGTGGGVAGTSGTGGARAGTGGAGGRADGGAGAGSGDTGTGGSDAGNCNLPATVSFQKDVQPFLSTTCGGGNGCHVIDSASTMANGGYDHAYDWITAGAHPSSCPRTPTPKRFEVVIAVIDAADPASCSKSREMPPQDETGANLRTPLTPCQVAALQAWLDQPLVTQMHRVDDTDPSGTPPFPMPPFN
jgi:hypothetical protein